MEEGVVIGKHEMQYEPDEQDIIDGITYDRQGRMEYNPLFHFNHGKHYTTSELIYICKYYEIDGRRNMSLAIGKTIKSITSTVWKLRQSGKWDYYKNFDDEAWETIPI
ncbi:DNA-entry nuclease [Paenibacillus antarcticus]|nr:DNA-entry nuclease [Paenibacillus antarcticus]